MWQRAGDAGEGEGFVVADDPWTGPGGPTRVVTGGVASNDVGHVAVMSPTL
jgi:hypothetical protein